MAITVQSTASTVFAAASSVVITKPTGLAVGDLMIAAVGCTGTNVTADVASGWTNITLNGSGGTMSIRLQYKVAVSGDVSASNFTFTGSGTSVATIAGAMLRVTGYASTVIATLSDSDSDGTSGTGGTFTSTLTPLAADSLVIFVYGAYGTNGAVPSVTSFSSTPSLTYTTLLSTGIDSGTTDPAFGVGYGIYSGTTQFTQYIGNVSRSQSSHLGLLYIVTPQVDVTGSNNLLSADADFFAPAASSGVVGTTALLSTDADLFSASGFSNSPTQWTNETKNTTTWTNEPKI